MKKIDEGSVRNEHVICDCLAFEQTKEYGCISYDANDNMVYLMEFDSIEDLNETFSADTESWADIDKVEVGTRVHDGYGHYYTRIW